MNASTYEHLKQIRARVDVMERFSLSVPPEIDQALAAVAQSLVDGLKAKAMDLDDTSDGARAKASALAGQLPK